MSEIYDAFTVKEYTNRSGEEKMVWTKIGRAWAHKNGGGYNLNIDALPVDGKIVLREPYDDNKSSGYSDHPF